MITMSYTEFRLRCPYGKWTCADGREVLFNRQYWPILERRPGETAKTANPTEWIHWKEQDYFFDDGNSPWQRHQRKAAADTLARCNRVLACPNRRRQRFLAAVSRVSRDVSCASEI
jgi:hypothetical protein